MRAWTFVPLRAKDGTVRALTLIDAEDWPMVGQHTWRLCEGRGGKTRYAARKEGGRTIQLHRVVADTPAGLETDHRNGNGLDNRRSNLRSATRAQNQQNRQRSEGRSALRGVSWHAQAGCWRATAVVQGKQHHLGLFDSEDEAGAAAATFRREHMPFAQEAA